MNFISTQSRSCPLNLPTENRVLCATFLVPDHSPHAPAQISPELASLLATPAKKNDFHPSSEQLTNLTWLAALRILGV